MDRATDARAQGGDDAASACRAVVVGLRLGPGWTAAAAYLEQGGRLRLQAVAGTQVACDGLAPSAGVAGRALRTAREVVEQRPAVPILDGEGTEVALPVRCHGDLAGVLVVAGPAPVAPADLREARRAAARLGEVLTALGPGGGAQRDAAARRLLRHAGALAGVEDAERIGPAVLRAALDVAPLRSALLATTTHDGSLEPRWSAGPLGDGLTEAAGPAALGALRDLVVHAGSAALALGRPGRAVPEALAPLHAAGARTLLVVALRHGGALTGLLVLADAGAPAPAGADAELLELLAAHAAASLQAAATATALRHRAETDPLTGLGHHATFHAALAGAHRRPLTAVVLADLDGFKALNDTRGHAHGDGVLRGVSRALQGALRRGDRLFRVGGDEFAALIAVESAEQARAAGERLRAAVARAGLGVTVSVGVALPQVGEPDAALLQRADRALYHVKEQGRDGVALAEDATTLS
jgi:diguanylate cyclase (GGDEF)-like protein